MRVLGIDQSYTSTGWVVKDGDSVLAVGILRSNPEQSIYKRCAYLAKEITALVKTWEVESVVIEGLAFGKFGNATRDLAGLQFSMIIRIMEQLGKDDDFVRIITPRSLKKYATGKGTAAKTDMYDALPEDVKQSFKTLNIKKTKGLYDVTDAYWLASYPQSLEAETTL